MKIEYSPHKLELVVQDMDRAMWLEGDKLYYAMPKDYRPEIYPYDLEDAMQVYYQLYRLAKDGYGLNQTPPELVDALENLKKLTEILTDYSNHVLGIVCKPTYITPQKLKK